TTLRRPRSRGRAARRSERACKPRSPRRSRSTPTGQHGERRARADCIEDRLTRTHASSVARRDRQAIYAFGLARAKGFVDVTPERRHKRRPLVPRQPGRARARRKRRACAFEKARALPIPEPQPGSRNLAPKPLTNATLVVPHPIGAKRWIARQCGKP